MATRRPGRRAAAVLLALALLAGCSRWGDATLFEDTFLLVNSTRRVLHAEAVGVELRDNGLSPVDVRGEVEVVNGRWVVPRSSGSIDISLFDAQCYGDGLRVYDAETGVLVKTYDQPLCGLTR